MQAARFWAQFSSTRQAYGSFVKLNKLAGWLVIMAIAVELSVSANLLTFLGVPYVTDGGNVVFKLHPGTYLLVAAFLALVFHQEVPMPSTLTTFLILMAACVFYTTVLTGTGNLVVLLDTFLPAGLLATVLSRTNSKLRHELRSTMQILLAANALLALGETAAHATLIPLYLNDSPYRPHVQDFRPTGLFDHPLTGSVMTLLALALAPHGGWCRFMYAALMWAALLAFGGRVAIFVTVMMTSGQYVTETLKLVLRRDPRAAARVCTAGAALAGAVLFAALAVYAGVGTRLVHHLYWDESAQVRLAQWRLLDGLDPWQWLFGTRRQDLLALLVPLRLGTGVEVVENFWLLMFVSLGLCGFPLFFASFLALLTWCWRMSQADGRLLLLGVLLVTSASNSLGRKSTVLVCTVAAISCITARPSPVSRRQAEGIDRYHCAAAA